MRRAAVRRDAKARPRLADPGSAARWRDHLWDGPVHRSLPETWRRPTERPARRYR